MNRSDLVKILRQVSANMDPEHEGVGMDLTTAKHQVDKLIEQGFLEYEDHQNLRIAFQRNVPANRPVTITFEIDGNEEPETFLRNMKRILPTTPMCLGPVSNLKEGKRG